MQNRRSKKFSACRFAPIGRYLARFGIGFHFLHALAWRMASHARYDPTVVEDEVMLEFWLPLVPFAAFFAWLLFFGMRTTKVCPDCNKPLEAIQSPFTKTKRQWVEGGFLCGHCGCETDLTGKKIDAGTPQTRRSIVVAIGVLTLAMVPTIGLLAMLAHR